MSPYTGPDGARPRRVMLIDDDAAVQRGVAALLEAADYSVRTFGSADAFLAARDAIDLDGAVLLVDVCMPGVQGLDLQERLAAEGSRVPVIVMTAHGDIPMAVRAMRGGAVDFLEKPFTVDEVTAALDLAFARPRVAPPRMASGGEALHASFASLTPREREVFAEIIDGSTNKEIARQLGISPRTVDVHRHRVMTKMNAPNLADLVRKAVALGVGA